MTSVCSCSGSSSSSSCGRFSSPTQSSLAVAPQRRVLAVQNVQSTVETLESKVAWWSAVLTTGVQTVQKTVEIPQVPGFVVDIPVIMQRRPDVPQISSSTEFTRISRRVEGGFFRSILRHFSDSVHLDVESWRTSDCLGSPRWPTVVGRRDLGGGGDGSFTRR